MTLEDEKRLSILAAILHLGGGGSKAKVLDTLETLGILKLSEYDREIMRSRHEERWRNDLAFIRTHLVAGRYLSNEGYDNWRITNRGRAYAQELAMRAYSQSGGNFVHLANAAALVQAVLSPSLDDEAADVKESVAHEGAVRQVWTTEYERNRELRDAAVRYHGLSCMACNFSFAAAYGNLGDGYIEVHHLNPVSTLQGPSKVCAETDLVVLCSNCHAIVHRRKGKPLTLPELKVLLIKSGKTP